MARRRRVVQGLRAPFGRYGALIGCGMKLPFDRFRHHTSAHQHRRRSRETLIAITRQEIQNNSQAAVNIWNNFPYLFISWLLFIFIFILFFFKKKNHSRASPQLCTNTIHPATHCSRSRSRSLTLWMHSASHLTVVSNHSHIDPSPSPKSSNQTSSLPRDLPGPHHFNRPYVGASYSFPRLHQPGPA